MSTDPKKRVHWRRNRDQIADGWQGLSWGGLWMEGRNPPGDLSPVAASAPVRMQVTVPMP
jgi:hypothetical protein